MNKNGNIIEEGYNDVKGVMCSAYKNTDSHWVVVAINYSEDVKPFCFKHSDETDCKWLMFRTSDISSESLAPVGTTDGNTCLTPRSVTTFVSE